MITAGIPEGTAYTGTIVASVIGTTVKGRSEGAAGVVSHSSITERITGARQANQTINYNHQHSISYK